MNLPHFHRHSIRVILKERPEAFVSDPQVIYLLEVTTKVTGCPNADASDQAVSSTTDQYASI